LLIDDNLGSYGKVREGIDPQTMQRIAVKIIDRKKILKMTGGEYVIQREINIHRKLKHRNVVQLLDSFKNDRKGKLYDSISLPFISFNNFF
jgi:serine/threonine-protein kinase 11